MDCRDCDIQDARCFEQCRDERDCDIPDVACHEQCRDEDKEKNCNGCFGASFLDCFECEKGKVEDEE